MREVFATLDKLEEILSHQRYLVGSQLTLADVRLYTTLVRFDLVYVGTFKVHDVHICNYTHIVSRFVTPKHERTVCTE